MTSALLQCIAIVTMLIDHMGYRLFPQYEIFRMIGRISFPIFAFMLVQGFIYTSSRKKYALRLAAFAIVSEIPYQLFSQGLLWNKYPWSNILFELLLGLAALWCVEKGKLWLLGAAGIVIVAETLDFMYGGYGILIAIGFYVFREKRWAGAACLVACTVLYCWYYHNPLQIYAVLAAIPLCLYNGKKGARLPRYFSYAFYPIHLLVIYGLDYLLAVI